MSEPGPTSSVADDGYRQAFATIERTLDKLRGCAPQELAGLHEDVRQLEAMHEKLAGGRIEIVIFGEISTGKSALINALVGKNVAAVDVRGGWTKEVWHVAWDGAGYCVPGLAQSQVVLIDTPGLNEVGGEARSVIAREAAQRADLILFVTDGDLTETEYSALLTLYSVHKPILVVLNKIDLYSPTDRQRLLDVLCRERLADVVPPDNVITAAADPREVEYVIESADGSTRSEWRKPVPNVAAVKGRILEVLEKDGLALLALNAAMYAADKSDRVAAFRVRFRESRANAAIGSYAVLKAAAVALNPVAVVDVVGGTAVDVALVATLARIYGLDLSAANSRELVQAIVKAAGWQTAMHLAAWAFKLATIGYGTVLTAVPQGAAAGYGSYIVGQAAKYYFEHGASWGGEAPKTVVHRILEQTDKESVLRHLKDEIRKKLRRNVHSESPAT